MNCERVLPFLTDEKLLKTNGISCWESSIPNEKVGPDVGGCSVVVSKWT